MMWHQWIKSQISSLIVHTYLQTIISTLQYLCVLRQAVLPQPPGNGAIIHVWTAGTEEIRTAYLGHMLVHVFQLECRRDMDMDMENSWTVHFYKAATLKERDLFGLQQLKYVALTCEQDPLRLSELQYLSASLELRPRTAWCPTLSPLSLRRKPPHNLNCNLFNSIYFVDTVPAHLLSKTSRRALSPASQGAEWGTPQIKARQISIISRWAEPACRLLSSRFRKQVEEEENACQVTDGMREASTRTSVLLWHLAVDSENSRRRKTLDR